MAGGHRDPDRAGQIRKTSTFCPNARVRLVAALADEGLWGPAMPLDAVAEKLGDNIWIAGIWRWVEYIETYDSDEWGDRQNRLGDSQLESARQSDIDVEHRRRVARAGRDDSEST